MFGLAIALIVAGLASLWLRARYRVKKWARLMKAATDAAERSDLPAAERFYEQAAAFANSKQSPILKVCALASQQNLAHTLFRAGQLDRAAAMSFDELQQVKGSP